MNADVFAAALRERLPELRFGAAELAGEGDYCAAFATDGDWIFLVAKGAEATRSLERVAALLPALAPTLPLAVPEVVYSGRLREDGPAFVGYRKVAGVELTGERFRALPAAERERCAAELAAFLRQIHRYPVEESQRAGVVACPYPFAATEDGLDMGPAAEAYRRDLDRLLAYPQVDEPVGGYLRRIVDDHLADPRLSAIEPVLLHGEVSGDHVLHDPATGRLTGVIDFNGVVIGDPARDLLYLAEEYGPAFIAALLAHYPADDPAYLLTRLDFYRQWHAALRLLWALDHGYEPGIARHLAHLRELAGR
jgi:aminoglycoside 2''-phosphotransferase